MKTLTSRERVRAAMNLEHPDRVPLMCQFSIGSMMTQLKPSPAEFWYDKNVFADGLITLCETFRFDGILVSLHGHSDKCKVILDKFANAVLNLAVQMCDKPIDAIKVSSPFAGMGFISSEQYADFVLPYEQKII